MTTITWRAPVAATLVGLLLLGGALLADAHTRRGQLRESAAVGQLRATLDSVRATLSRASARVDSTRLSEEVASREYYLGRREYHLAGLQATVLGWWEPTGTGTLLVLQGAVLTLSGLGLLARRRSRAA